MAKLTSDSSAVLSGLFADDANPQAELGQKIVTADGREFRYVKAGGTALVAGNLLQARAEDTGEQDLTPTATAIGATSITTSSTVTVTANQYAGGYVVVTTTPGNGLMYRIASHPAATAAALTITLEDPIDVALTTGSRIDLVPNQYDGVVVSPTTPTGAVVGVAVNNVTASQYGWIQTKGLATVLAEGTVTVGLPVVASNTTAGAVETIADGANELLQVVGVAATGIATGENGSILLNLP